MSITYTRKQALKLLNTFLDNNRPNNNFYSAIPKLSSRRCIISKVPRDDLNKDHREQLKKEKKVLYIHTTNNQKEMPTLDR